MLILIIAILAFVYLLYKENEKYVWSLQPIHNFPFTWKGKEYWYSRACAVAIFVYCKNSLGEWCVLANQRGKGTPDYQGYWNGICGYLDWNEDSIKGSLRELSEETGLHIPSDKVEIIGVNSSPENNHQNVVIFHRAILDGVTDDWSSFSTENMEKDEVEAIKWIPLKDVNNYKWAFDHGKKIIDFGVN